MSRSCVRFVLILAVTVLSSVGLTFSSNECRVGHSVFILNGTDGVVVTYRSSAGAFDRVTFGNDFIPSDCGSDFKRCRNPAVVEQGGNMVLVIPVVRGAALVKLERQDESFHFSSHHVMLLPPEFNCRLTTVFKRSPSYLGFCVNIESTDETIRPVYLNIIFDNLTMSVFEADAQLPIDALEFPETLSEFILIENLACADFEDFVFYLHDAFLRSLIVDLDDYDEQYDLDGFVTQCTFTSRFQKISDVELVAYCSDDTTVVLDVCQRSLQIVDNIEPYDAVMDGTPYFCDSAKDNVVVHRSETLMLTSLNEEVLVIPFPSERIITGDCYTLGDETIFVYATENGEIYLTRIRDNSTQYLGKNDNTLASSLPFMLHSGTVVVNNGSESLVYNDSCQANPVIVQNDHPSDLSLLFVDDSTLSCQCFVEQTDTPPTCDPGSTNLNCSEVTGSASSPPSTVDTTIQPSPSTPTTAIESTPTFLTIGPLETASQSISVRRVVTSTVINPPTTPGPDLIDETIELMQLDNSGVIAGVASAVAAVTLIAAVVIFATTCFIIMYRKRRTQHKLIRQVEIALTSLSSSSSDADRLNFEFGQERSESSDQKPNSGQSENEESRSSPGETPNTTEPVNLSPSKHSSEAIQKAAPDHNHLAQQFSSTVEEDNSELSSTSQATAILHSESVDESLQLSQSPTNNVQTQMKSTVKQKPLNASNSSTIGTSMGASESNDRSYEGDVPLDSTVTCMESKSQAISSLNKSILSVNNLSQDSKCTDEQKPPEMINGDTIGLSSIDTAIANESHLHVYDSGVPKLIPHVPSNSCTDSKSCSSQSRSSINNLSQDSESASERHDHASIELAESELEDDKKPILIDKNKNVHTFPVILPDFKSSDESDNNSQTPLLSRDTSRSSTSSPEPNAVRGELSDANLFPVTVDPEEESNLQSGRDASVLEPSSPGHLTSPVQAVSEEASAVMFEGAEVRTPGDVYLRTGASILHYRQFSNDQASQAIDNSRPSN